MADRFVHIVWSSATGPIVAYENPSMAYTHARSMLGVDVASLKITTRLPPVVLEDLGDDFEEDETPTDVPRSRTRTPTVKVVTIPECDATVDVDEID